MSILTNIYFVDSMKPYDPSGNTGPKKPLPDTVTIIEPPVDKLISEPTSEQRGPPPPTATVPEVAGEPTYTEAAPTSYEPEEDAPAF